MLGFQFGTQPNITERHLPASTVRSLLILGAKTGELKIRVSVVQFHPWPHFQAIRSVRATWRRDGPSRFSLGRGGVTIASIERFV